MTRFYETRNWWEWCPVTETAIEAILKFPKTHTNMWEAHLDRLIQMLGRSKS